MQSSRYFVIYSPDQEVPLPLRPYSLELDGGVCLPDVLQGFDPPEVCAFANPN
jgi:hypothetical protein